MADREASQSTLSRRTALAAAGRGAAAGLGALLLPVGAAAAAAQDDRAPHDVATGWFDVALRLAQGTPGFSPPVAARALGVTGAALLAAVDAAAARPGASVDPVATADAALATAVRALWARAPEGLRLEVEALAAAGARSRPGGGVHRRSVEAGVAAAQQVLAVAATDGGHDADVRPPVPWSPPAVPGAWEPTPPRYLPALLPTWGSNRCLVLTDADAPDPGPPPAFAPEPGSESWAEAVEVHDVVVRLDDAQRATVAFWADEPGRTPTPAGHSVSLLTQALRDRGATLGQAAVAYAAVGAAVSDAFVCCWATKYRYAHLRPVTYVERYLRPGWSELLPLTTPPFPEHTSGHSVQSAAAAEVLTALFGEGPVHDTTHVGRGLPARTFPSFRAAAQEAATSRLLGGIHFRSAVELGVAQGRSVGHAVVSAYGLDR